MKHIGKVISERGSLSARYISFEMPPGLLFFQLFWRVAIERKTAHEL